MSFRRAPNPNRNFPLYCPWCAGEQLFPAEDSDFAWICADCARLFEVKYFGQDDPPARPAPAPSTAEANRESLHRHEGSPILGGNREDDHAPESFPASNGARL